MRWRGRLAAAAAAVALLAMPLAASGPPLLPNYVDPDGRSPVELARFHAGRLPVVMPAGREGTLYMAWRLLHLLPVGAEAGKLLSVRCCDAPPSSGRGMWAWVDERAKVVPSSSQFFFVEASRAGPDYQRTPNCFDEAFERAAATLRDRVRRYRARSASVRAWVDAQDGVFSACSNAQASLPPLPANAPPWLKADRAYQEAAFHLYAGRNVEAARRFATIAADRSSPWRPLGLYLETRSLQREAVERPQAASFAAAKAAAAKLAAAPPGTFGRGEAKKMRNAIAYREEPAAYLARLDERLRARGIGQDSAVELHDYLKLSRKTPQRPETADWILTITPWREIQWGEDLNAKLAAALAHARERWAATRDVAWLIAALSLTEPATPAAAPLARDAADVPRNHPGWRTAEYHRIRLTFGETPESSLRTRLDSILADPALSRSERNLFSGMRTQVARDLADFARFSLRRPGCPADWGDCQDRSWFDFPIFGKLPGGTLVAFGEEAVAMIDRLPLDKRIALSRNPSIPRDLRLDLALTSFARAVLLRRDGTVDVLARDLALLLPQMRREWRAIPAARGRPARSFAIHFAMAKIPGLKADLALYVRPQGTISQFQGTWADWVMLDPRKVPAAKAELPPYRSSYDGGWDGTRDDDLACFGKCGVGAFPLRFPAFLRAEEPRAAEERARFATKLSYENRFRLPEGAVSVWDELFAYARAHPRGPRSPESLYWLIHIARWGPNRDHLGKRAFALLHRRYPGSYWAKRSPFYYD